ncbi:sugar phosphate isomerase/epimerase family protein [Hirschia litorea]|uniref:Sugar phosphate isomerase/epimerase family protein n=1 Tax=Hirschia litorea TaxID=1199156 RepID=A0ABW2IP20_9PROT
MFLGRREFLVGALATSGLASACSTHSSQTKSDQNWSSRGGVQLYTLKEMMAENPTLSLKSVAAAGYREVEFAGYFDKTPQEYKSILNGEGLKAPSFHLSYQECLQQDKLEEGINAAQILNHKYLVVPYLVEGDRQSLDDYREVAANLSKIAETCRAAGIGFAYHNHEFEFIELEGEIPYDILLTQTDADLVKMELDLCWVHAAGKSAVEYINANPGRFPLFHVKDITADGTLVPVGQGTVDFAAVFAAAGTAGLRHAYVEHDRATDPIASISESFTFLKNAKIKMPALS